MLGTAKRKLSEQLPPGWPKFPTTLESLHKEDQQINKRNEYAESEDNLQFELESPSEQEIAEGKKKEQQYEIQYTANTTYSGEPINKDNVHTQFKEENKELPSLWP